MACGCQNKTQPAPTKPTCTSTPPPRNQSCNADLCDLQCRVNQLEKDVRNIFNRLSKVENMIINGDIYNELVKKINIMGGLVDFTAGNNINITEP